MIHVRIHVHLDDFHSWIEGDHQDAGHAQDWIRELLDQGYDITAVEADGVAWDHYPYGAQWGPKRLTGWQPCVACGSTHPVTSEC